MLSEVLSSKRIFFLVIMLVFLSFFSPLSDAATCKAGDSCDYPNTQFYYNTIGVGLRDDSDYHSDCTCTIDDDEKCGSFEAWCATFGHTYYLPNKEYCRSDPFWGILKDHCMDSDDTTKDVGAAFFTVLVDHEGSSEAPIWSVDGNPVKKDYDPWYIRKVITTATFYEESKFDLSVSCIRQVYDLPHPEVTVEKNRCPENTDYVCLYGEDYGYINFKFDVDTDDLIHMANRCKGDGGFFNVWLDGEGIEKMYCGSEYVNDFTIQDQMWNSVGLLEVGRGEHSITIQPFLPQHEVFVDKIYLNSWETYRSGLHGIGATKDNPKWGEPVIFDIEDCDAVYLSFIDDTYGAANDREIWINSIDICGDGTCDGSGKGAETKSNCCSDCGCPSGYTCNEATQTCEEEAPPPPTCPPEDLCSENNLCEVKNCGGTDYYCTNEPNWGWRTSKSCNDYDDCTDNDVCVGGGCSGSEKWCPDGYVCVGGSCKKEFQCISSDDISTCGGDFVMDGDDICCDPLMKTNRGGILYNYRGNYKDYLCAGLNAAWLSAKGYKGDMVFAEYSYRVRDGGFDALSNGGSWIECNTDGKKERIGCGMTYDDGDKETVTKGDLEHQYLCTNKWDTDEWVECCGASKESCFSETHGRRKTSKDFNTKINNVEGYVCCDNGKFRKASDANILTNKASYTADCQNEIDRCCLAGDNGEIFYDGGDVWLCKDQRWKSAWDSNGQIYDTGKFDALSNANTWFECNVDGSKEREGCGQMKTKGVKVNTGGHDYICTNDWDYETWSECCGDGNCINGRDGVNVKTGKVVEGHKCCRDSKFCSITNQCCKAAIGLSGCAPTRWLNPDKTWLCATGSDADWFECNEENVGTKKEIEDSTFTCSLVNDNYSWVEFEKPRFQPLNFLTRIIKLIFFGP